MNQYLPFEAANLDDVAAIFTQTFSDAEGEKEGKAVGELARNLLVQTSPDELHSYIAMQNDRVVAAIIFTKITFEQKITAYILSPVAVCTNLQGQGIGQKLIRYGLEELKNKRIELVFTYGDPNYYKLIGFNQITEKQCQAPFRLSYPHGWLCQSIANHGLSSTETFSISGASYCVSALNKPEYW